MQKLIDSYRDDDNNDKKRARIQKYLNAHPMASCLMTENDRTFLRLKGVTV